jgi:ketosteroid isomerase-like protein
MPWFPEFTTAVALVRRETQVAGQADPVKQYFTALNEGDSHALETVWPGTVVIQDPVAGEVRGHRQLQDFVSHNRSWLTERHARIETVTSTVANGRAVVELLAHLEADDGRELSWPIAVVAESTDDRSIVFRTYCRRWPVDEPLRVRPPLLEAANIELTDIVGRYLRAQDAGDADAAANTFAPDGYFREPYGPGSLHRGARELKAFFAERFSAGGGIILEHCAVTDDGVRCALEYNCVRWGEHDLPAQAGLGVYERDSEGLLAAARIYDEIEAPGTRATAETSTR